jgi:predicted CoA-binding protein
MEVVTLREAADDFLAHQRVAVAGVSREADGAHSGNGVYQRLRERGFQVFAVNPNAEEVEGDKCYHSLADIPGGVEAVVIATAAKDSPSVMKDCIDLGIDQVWLHRALGAGSYSSEAEQMGREAGIRVIPGGCPLMFEPCDDGGHRFLRTLCTWTGAVPRKV